MKRLMFGSLIIIIFFLCACVSLFIGTVAANIESGNNYCKTESIKAEAKSFFYKTIHEVYMGTYNPKDGSVSENLLKKFEDKEFRAKFNPICHLETVELKYGDTYFGLVSSKSDYVFEVEIIKINGKWSLFYLEDFNAKSFWKDIREDK
jgi:hypothetical protein